MIHSTIVNYLKNFEKKDERTIFVSCLPNQTISLKDIRTNIEAKRAIIKIYSQCQSASSIMLKPFYLTLIQLADDDELFAMAKNLDIHEHMKFMRLVNLK